MSDNVKFWLLIAAILTAAFVGASYETHTYCEHETETRNGTVCWDWWYGDKP